MLNLFVMVIICDVLIDYLERDSNLIKIRMLINLKRRTLRLLNCNCRLPELNISGSNFLDAPPGSAVRGQYGDQFRIAYLELLLICHHHFTWDNPSSSNTGPNIQTGTLLKCRLILVNGHYCCCHLSDSSSIARQETIFDIILLEKLRKLRHLFISTSQYGNLSATSKKVQFITSLVKTQLFKVSFVLTCTRRVWNLHFCIHVAYVIEQSLVWLITCINNEW